MTGNVIAKLTQPIVSSAYQVCVHLIGKEYYMIVIDAGDSGTKVNTSEHVIVSLQQRILTTTATTANSKTMLLRAASSQQNVETINDETRLTTITTYTFPFEMKLPIDIPSSMGGYESLGGRGDYCTWKIYYEMYVTILHVDDRTANAPTRSHDASINKMGCRSIDILSSPILERTTATATTAAAELEQNNKVEQPPTPPPRYFTFHRSRHLLLLDCIHKGFISFGVYIPHGNTCIRVLRRAGGSSDSRNRICSGGTSSEAMEDMHIHVAIRNDSTCYIKSIDIGLHEIVNLDGVDLIDRVVYQCTWFPDRIWDMSLPLYHKKKDVPKQYPNLPVVMMDELINQSEEKKKSDGVKVVIPLSRRKRRKYQQQPNHHQQHQQQQQPLFHYESYKGKYIHIKYLVVIMIKTKNDFVNNASFQFPIQVGF